MRRRAKRERDAVVEVPHMRTCYALQNALKGSWATPWAYLDRERPYAWGTVTGNLKAKSRNNTRWLRFICNCTHCPARLLVNEERLLETFGKIE